MASNKIIILLFSYLFPTCFCFQYLGDVPQSPKSCPSYILARFLAAAGHIALQQVVHLETSVLGEIKRRERLKEDSKGGKKIRTSTTTSVSETPRNKVKASF